MSKVYNQIVYGSLLNTNELQKQGISIDDIVFVKLKGFKRVFNQLPSWREVEGIEKAVMNIEADENAWMNAIAIKGLSDEQLEALDERERGYDRLHLKDGDVTIYGSGGVLSDCVVYRGKEGKQSSEILPNKEYFQICLEGAKSHFGEFYEDYLRTTFKNSLEGGLVSII